MKSGFVVVGTLGSRIKCASGSFFESARFGCVDLKPEDLDLGRRVFNSGCGLGSVYLAGRKGLIDRDRGAQARAIEAA